MLLCEIQTHNQLWCDGGGVGFSSERLFRLSNMRVEARSCIGNFAEEYINEFLS